MKVKLTDKRSDYVEFGEYLSTTVDNFVIKADTGLVKLYLIRNWECEAVRDE